MTRDDDMPASIAVCGHVSRHDAAVALAGELDAVLVEDDGQHGSNENHRRAWLEAAERFPTRPWVGVVEDDALPVAGWEAPLKSLLRDAPADLVSGYLGTGMPAANQPDLERLFAGCLPAWIIADDLLHHVAVFARRELVPGIARALEAPGLPCDQRLGVWARGQRHPVAYPVPSPFDHADTDPVIVGRTPRGIRRAWLAGQWSPGVAVPLDTATVNRYSLWA